MPPKKNGAVASGAGPDQSVLSLIRLIMSCGDEFKPNMKVAAELLGISHAKNVGRAINGILKPHGYEFKFGKIVETGQNGNGDANEAQDAADATKPASGAASPNDAADGAAPAKPKAKGPPAKARAPKSSRPATKKRKFAKVDDEDDEADGDEGA